MANCESARITGLYDRRNEPTQPLRNGAPKSLLFSNHLFTESLKTGLFRNWQVTMMQIRAAPRPSRCKNLRFWHAMKLLSSPTSLHPSPPFCRFYCRFRLPFGRAKSVCGIMVSDWDESRNLTFRALMFEKWTGDRVSGFQSSGRKRAEPSEDRSYTDLRSR